MGFRKDAYAKVWEIEDKGPTCTKLRISISRKNKETGEYEQDFNGYVMAIGTACAASAAKLTKGDTIKLGSVDVSNRYDKEAKREWTTYKIFEFSTDGVSKNTQAENKAAEQKKNDVDESEPSENLPF